MNVQIEPSWQRQLGAEFEKDYFARLTHLVREEYGRYACYPPGRLIFNAFNLCPFDKVKDGRLADVAPSILHIMGLEQPADMTGECLIEDK